MAAWIRWIIQQQSHMLPLLSLHSQVIKSEDSSAKCQKAAGGKPQREPGFIVMLFDYTQVKWKVYLHPLKITFSLRKNWHVVRFVIAPHREKGSQMNEDTVATWHRLWYSHFLSPLNTKFRCRQKNTLTESRPNVGLRPSPPASHPHLCSTRSVLGQFSDDRQWQSRAELHGSCLSSGCSVWLCVWCSPGSPPAPSLTVGPWHQTQTELKSGGQEGRKLTSKDSQLRKKNNSHSSLSHCLYFVTYFEGFAELFSVERRKAELR